MEQAEDCGGDENETRLARDALAQFTANVRAVLFWGDGDLKRNTHERSRGSAARGSATGSLGRLRSGLLFLFRHR